MENDVLEDERNERVFKEVEELKTRRTHIEELIGIAKRNMRIAESAIIKYGREIQVIDKKLSDLKPVRKVAEKSLESYVVDVFREDNEATGYWEDVLKRANQRKNEEMVDARSRT